MTVEIGSEQSQPESSSANPAQDDKLEEAQAQEDTSSALQRIKEKVSEDDTAPIGSLSLKQIVGGDYLFIAVRHHIWLIMLIVLLCTVYVGVRYQCEQDVLEIDQLEKDLVNAKYKAMSSSSNLTELCRQSNVPARTADAIIQDIITYHGCYDHKADTKVSELLDELNTVDSKQGELWKKIMEYWDYANNEMTVNLEKLPDNLPKDSSLAITVLGFELNDDGTMKDELFGRLDTALKCSEQYPNAYVICTGGGTAKNNKEVTEAGLMGDWLKEHGLSENRLIIEDRSMTTAQNAEFSYKIILDKYPSINSIAIVSSSYHIAWGSLLFEAEFMKYALENNVPEIHVVSNCAYKTSNETYKESEILRWETGGMLQLVGNNDLAMKYYTNQYEKPAL